MKGFTKGLVKRRILVIVVCLLLLVPSILGMAATKTKYDLLYYLPQDLETVQGQEILLQDLFITIQDLYSLNQLILVFEKSFWKIQRQIL